MSKAFTREDDAIDEPLLIRPPTQLPAGVKNYITPDGARRLREELNFLVQVERPRMASDLTEESVEGHVAVVDKRRQLQLLDQQILSIGQSLQLAEIVEPPLVPEDIVRFGSTVTARDQSGEEMVYRIVGIDETDLNRNWVSWRSPIARALLNARLGQTVRFRFPAGEKQLKIEKIIYE